MGRSLLFKTEYRINDYITIKVPTVAEIIDNEDEYYDAVFLIISTPYERMVQLADMDIDFTTIDEWDLFLLLFSELRYRDISMIFRDLQLSDFQTVQDERNGEIILLNFETGAIIDRKLHMQICTFLRKLLNIEKNDKKPGNEDGKEWMLERARVELRKRLRLAKDSSQLEEHIIALVNTAEFSYDYESVRDLTIYQFNSSLNQIIKKVRFDNLMIGCYAGTINAKELNPDELNWLTSR